MPKRESAAQDASTTTKRKRVASSSTGTRRVTRRMTTDTAELLEQIVLELPPATILTSQRVCHQFQDIVTTSTKIQQKLFYRTNGKHERWISLKPDDYEAPIRRLEDKEEHKKFVKVPSRLNDFFRPEIPDKYFYDRFQDGEIIVPNPELTAELFRMLRETDRVSSCNGMQLTDTPTTKASIWFRWTVCDGLASGSVREEVESPTGITVGDLVKAIDTSSMHGVYHIGTFHRQQVAAGEFDGMVRAMEEMYGGIAELENYEVILHGVVIPSQREKEKLMRGEILETDW